MTIRSSASTAALIATLSLASAPAASASDASIRDGVKAAESAVQPDADAWAQSVKAFSQNNDPAPVRAATQKLIGDLTNERRLLSGQRASTARVRRGKVLYMVALRKLRGGLMSFDKALASMQGGQASDVKAQLKKFVARIKASDKAGSRAERLIGVKSS
jgi:hypothetical protein